MRCFLSHCRNRFMIGDIVATRRRVIKQRETDIEVVIELFGLSFNACMSEFELFDGQDRDAARELLDVDVDHCF